MIRLLDARTRTIADMEDFETFCVLEEFSSKNPQVYMRVRVASETKSVVLENQNINHIPVVNIRFGTIHAKSPDIKVLRVHIDMRIIGTCNEEERCTWGTSMKEGKDKSG